MAARKQKMEVAVFFAFEQFVQPDFLLRISQMRYKMPYKMPLGA